MRASRSQAEKSHRDVVIVASHLFRKNGYDGIGIQDIMQSAGMTSGGFYKKFASKEDLIQQATAYALEESAANCNQAVQGNGNDGLAGLLDFYLSARHRDAPALGCGLAALGQEAPRHDPALRAVFEQGVRAHLALLKTVLDDPAGDKALAALATMVGALMLSRSVADEALSLRCLEVAKAALLDGKAIPA